MGVSPLEINECTLIVGGALLLPFRQKRFSRSTWIEHRRRWKRRDLPHGDDRASDTKFIPARFGATRRCHRAAYYTPVDRTCTAVITMWFTGAMVVIDIPTLSVNATVNFASAFNVTSGVNGQTGSRRRGADRFSALAVSASRKQRHESLFNVGYLTVRCIDSPCCVCPVSSTYGVLYPCDNNITIFPRRARLRAEAVGAASLSLSLPVSPAKFLDLRVVKSLAGGFILTTKCFTVIASGIRSIRETKRINDNAYKRYAPPLIQTQFSRRCWSWDDFYLFYFFFFSFEAPRLFSLLWISRWSNNSWYLFCLRCVLGRSASWWSRFVREEFLMSLISRIRWMLIRSCWFMFPNLLNLLIKHIWQNCENK